ncbi:hypothetical protein Tco_0487760 [Tanacetum coccineum]
MERLAKIEFLKFSGDDVKGWVFRCDQFFLMEQTLEMDKYETTAIEYEDAFDNLLSWVEVSEDHDVSLFMGGLPTKIEMGVRIAKNISRCLLFNKFTRSYIEMLLRRRIKALLLLTIQGSLKSLNNLPNPKAFHCSFDERLYSIALHALLWLFAFLSSSYCSSIDDKGTYPSETSYHLYRNCRSITEPVNIKFCIWIS